MKNRLVSAALLFAVFVSICSCGTKKPPIVSEAPIAVTAEPVVFTDGKLSMAEFFSNYQYKSATSGKARFVVENYVFDHIDPEAEYSRFLADVERIKSVTGESKEFSLYILPVMPEGVAPIQEDVSVMICRPAEIGTAAYYENLVSKVTGVSETWKTIGLAALIFPETNAEPYDNGEIAEYLINTEDLSILDLFTTRFINEYNTDEEVQMARSIAHSLSAFVFENHTIGEFINDSFSKQELINEWLTDLRVGRLFTASELPGLMKIWQNTDYTYVLCEPGIRFSFSNTIDESGRRSYASSWNENNQDLKDRWFKIAKIIDSASIERFIRNYCACEDFINDYLRMNAPRYYSDLTVIRPAAQKVILVLDNNIPPNAGGHTELFSSIYLPMSNYRYAYGHEIAHNYVTNDTNRGTFLNEGMCSYLGDVIFPLSDATEDDRITFEYIIRDAETQEDYDFINEFEQILDRYSSGTENKDNMTNISYDEIRAYIKLKKEDFVQNRNYTHGSYAGIGQDLTFKQTQLFVMYLSNTYGLDTVFDYLKYATPIEANDEALILSVFGKSYTELTVDWYNYLALKCEGEAGE